MISYMYNTGILMWPSSRLRSGWPALAITLARHEINM